MSEEPQGLIANPLFTAATRPPTRWGVPYLALLVNGVVTMEVFLMIKNPLIVLLALPVHGVCMLLCAREARFFELGLLWAQTRMPGLIGNSSAWRGNTYSPLILDLPKASGARRHIPTAMV